MNSKPDPMKFGTKDECEEIGYHYATSLNGEYYCFRCGEKMPKEQDDE